MNRKKICWSILETEGEKPKPRGHHKMVLQINLGILIVYAGKNDEYGEFSYFDDLMILKLSNLNWISVSFVNMSSIPRCSFYMSVFSNYILLLKYFSFIFLE